MEGFIASVFGGTALRFKRALRATAFQIIAGIFFCVSLAFLTTGGFILLAQVHGTAMAAIAIGIGYGAVSLCLLAIYAATFGRASQKIIPKPAVSPVDDIKHDVGDVLNDIAQNGFKTSHLALMSTLPVFRSVKPVHLAALGLLAGFISGKKMGR
jgi:hypothetical protein